MAEPISIRPVRPFDFAQWLPLWEGYNAFYGRLGATALPEIVTRTTWARFFDAYEPVHAWVAADGDDLVGLAHYLYHRSTVMLAPVCYMQDLFTAEAVRGRGVATALVEAVYQQAREAGVSRVYWQTHEANAVARRLYDKLASQSGFIVYRTDV
jgi:GNAT superfamily N-acetyltransferase